MDEIMRVTNESLALMLGTIQGQLGGVTEKVENLEKLLNGNGKPGLLQDHRDLVALVAEHLKQAKEDKIAKDLLAKQADEAKVLLTSEAKEAINKLATETKERKEKISNRTWAVILMMLTQLAGLIILFIRTGSLH